MTDHPPTDAAESGDARPSRGGAQNEQCPDCEMPECVGSYDDEAKAVRDPSDNLVEMCESCLDDGWRDVVEVLE